MSVRQVFPLPGAQYDQGYMQQLIRALNSYVERMAATGPLVGSSLMIVSLPHSGYLLPVGSFWSNSGIVHVVESNQGCAGGVAGTATLGTVTVTTV